MRIKTLLIAVLFPALINAQTIADSIIVNSIPEQNSYNLNYLRQFYTHTLNSALNAAVKSGNFNSGLLINMASVVSTSGTKSIRDQNQLGFTAGYNLHPALNFSVVTSYEHFKDTRETGLNFLSNTEALALSRYAPLPYFSSALFYGIIQNKQLGDYEKGAKYGVTTSLNNFDEYELLVNSNLIFERERINLRNKNTSALRLKVEKQFEPNIKTVFYSGYHNKSRDYYILADSGLINEYGITKNVLTRNEEELQLNGIIAVDNIYDRVSAAIDAALFSRTVSRLSRYKSYQLIGENIFDSKIEELNFSVNANVDYLSDILRLRLATGLSNRDERHNAIPISGINQVFFEARTESESRKNNLARRAFLTLYTEVNPSKKDKVILQLFQSKLTYDTPNQNNYDDRDELLSVARLRLSREISPGLVVFAAGEFTFSRLVYIYSQKSSNNITGRFYKFNTGNEITNGFIDSRNTFEVSANYSVYDFEDIVSGYKSFSFRQLYFSDSTTIHLTKSIKLGFTGHYRLSEQAELRWSEFSIRPIRLLEEILIFPKLSATQRSATFSLGLRLFSILTYGYTGDAKKLSNEFSSIAPAAEVEYINPTGLILIIRGWHEFNTTGKNERFRLTNLNSEIRYFF